MSKPKISIIIPVYNTEEYLEQSLDSVIHQTFKEIEIICIDDGSTDKSSDILQQYAETDGRIKVISQTNHSVSEARNIGLCNAAAEYVMFLDSDDWMERNTCETAYEVVRQQEADVVMWSYIREFKNRSIPKKIFDNSASQIAFEGKEVQTVQRRMVGLLGEELKNPEVMDALSAVWGKIYRRQLIVQNNIKFMDINKIGSAEDALFNLQLFGYVTKAVFINKEFNHYNKSNCRSITNNLGPDLYEQRRNLFACMQAYITENRLDETFQRALDNRVALSIVGLGLNILKRDGNAVQKIHEIRFIITSKRYRTVYTQLELTYFPIYWKLFYFLAKHRCAAGVYAMLWGIRMMKRLV